MYIRSVHRPSLDLSGARGILTVRAQGGDGTLAGVRQSKSWEEILSSKSKLKGRQEKAAATAVELEAETRWTRDERRDNKRRYSRDMGARGRVTADLPSLVGRATSGLEVSREKSQRPFYFVDLAGSQISWSANAWRYWVLQQTACQGCLSQTNALETQVSREEEKSAFQPAKQGDDARRRDRGRDKRLHYGYGYTR